MAQDVATQTWSTFEVQPVGAVARSYALLVRLAASTVYPAGSPLALVANSTTETYQLYTRSASDGSQNAECILRRACATDSAGNITYGAAATGGEWGQTEPGGTTSAWFGGVFKVADIPSSGSHGLDAAAVTAMGGKLQLAGAILSF